MTDPYLHPKYSDLQKEYQDLIKCNRCGFCETVCPTYMVSGKETLSPRGRNQAFRQILEGKNLNPKSAMEIFSTCLTCHACTNVCFSQVPVARLMASARGVSQVDQRIPSLSSHLFKIFLSHRKILSILLWILFLFKRIKFSSLLNKCGLLEKVSPEAAAAEDLIQDVPLSFGGKRGKQKSMDPTKKPRLAYFSGCGTHYLFPRVTQSFVTLMEKMDPAALFPNHGCCGLIAHSQGDIETARVLARNNIQKFSQWDDTTILVDDDSCCGFMKSYPELLRGDSKAIEFSKRVRNLSEVLVDSKWIPPVRAPKIKVTYHDPCQMGNGHLQLDSPRTILKRVQGIEFVEMRESNWCCGGAGSYCLKHPHLSEDILERKLVHIQESQAQMVLTQASSCLLHIRYGIRKKGLDKKIEVQHLAEWINQNNLS